MSGNRGTPGDVVRPPGAQDDPGEGGAGRVAAPRAGGVRSRLARPGPGSAWLRGFRLSPPGKVMVASTLLALAIRLFTLTRPGYLTGITEYDDGVYLGAAIRLTEGAVPYRDFAFVQPPGILILMAPVALLAKATTAVKALALARVLTALASTACVPLAGNAVRYRGTIVTLVTCSFLAIYPDDVTTAHTLMLEPWMNLLCLLAVNAALRRGHLASPRRLAWAGVALGFATAVKFWAGAPAAVLLILCLLWGTQRARRAGLYLAGLAAGFAAGVAPFALSAPVAFWNSTVSDQADRVGTYVPVTERLAHITGLIDVLNTNWHLSLNAGAQSIFAAGSAARLPGSSGAGLLPYVVTVIAAGVLAACYALRRQQLSHLELLALGTTIISSAAILGYSAFFYHYPDFPAPWLALSVGGAAAILAGRPAWRKPAVGVIALVVVGVAALQIREMFPMRQPTAEASSHYIPKGACVVSDEVSLTIAADRFGALPAGCPDIVDSLASTLKLSKGVSIQGGAAAMPAVVATWQSWLSRAQYVWLSPNHGYERRIPWTPALRAWFSAHFTKVGGYSTGTGQIYVRDAGP